VLLRLFVSVGFVPIAAVQGIGWTIRKLSFIFFENCPVFLAQKMHNSIFPFYPLGETELL
jgi:hypothetical protein